MIFFTSTYCKIHFLKIYSLLSDKILFIFKLVLMMLEGIVGSSNLSEVPATSTITKHLDSYNSYDDTMQRSQENEN